MFRNGTTIEQFNVRIDLNYGGLGDLLARLPAIRYAYNQWPHLNMYVFCYDYSYKLLEACLKPFNDRVYLMPFSAQKRWLERSWCARMAALDFTPTMITGVRMHLTEQGFITICDKTPHNTKEWNYLQPDLTNIDVSEYNIPESYGVLCTERTAPVREWPAQEVNKVARWMLQNKITPVFLGKSSNELGADKGQVETQSEVKPLEGVLDLRDQTSLLEATKILANAKFVAGVDNGLLHLASLSDVPTIWGFTTVEPEQRLPYRHGSQRYRALTVEPDKTLDCRYCQSNQHFVMVEGRPWNYKNCMYGDQLCTTQMTAGKFIRQIKHVINFKGYEV